MVEAAAQWRCSPVQSREAGDTAAPDHGLVQVPTSHQRTQELGQDEYRHELANGLLTPEHPVGTHHQVSGVTRGPQSRDPSTPHGHH